MVPTKAASPRLVGDIGGNSFTAVIDEGSELNCIDYQFAVDMNIEIADTDAGATAAGENPVQIAGVTARNFIFYTAAGEARIPIDCQKAVVVYNLGSEVLVGEPGKFYNDIRTSARSRTIILKHDGRTYKKPYLESSGRHYGLARLRHQQTICSGDSVRLPVPAHLSTERTFLLTPRRGQTRWFEPGFYQQQDGALVVTNTSHLPAVIPSRQPFGDIRTCTEIHLSHLKSRPAPPSVDPCRGNPLQFQLPRYSSS